MVQKEKVFYKIKLKAGMGGWLQYNYFFIGTKGKSILQNRLKAGMGGWLQIQLFFIQSINKYFTKSIESWNGGLVANTIIFYTKYK